MHSLVKFTNISANWFFAVFCVTMSCKFNQAPEKVTSHVRDATNSKISWFVSWSFLFFFYSPQNYLFEKRNNACIIRDVNIGSKIIKSFAFFKNMTLGIFWFFLSFSLSVSSSSVSLCMRCRSVADSSFCTFA